MEEFDASLTSSGQQRDAKVGDGLRKQVGDCRATDFGVTRVAA